jgi:Arc/MetJ family transcription regulator
MCLTDAYRDSIIVCIRTTININDELLAKARDYTGEKEKTKLLHLGLEALIQREIANRLAALGGAMPDLKVPPRRRSARKRT